MPSYFLSLKPGPPALPAFLHSPCSLPSRLPRVDIFSIAECLAPGLARPAVSRFDWRPSYPCYLVSWPPSLTCTSARSLLPSITPAICPCPVEIAECLAPLAHRHFCHPTLLFLPLGRNRILQCLPNLTCIWASSWLPLITPATH